MVFRCNMKNNEYQNGKTNVLRANISIITRGGPLKIHTNQKTNPVLLEGMELPAEANYELMDLTGKQSFAIDNPVSIELFFGDNGWQGDDISLGEYYLEKFLPTFAGSGKINLKLVVNTEQTLSISILDHTSLYYRCIGFIDISELEPPDVKVEPKRSVAEFNTFMSQQISDLYLDSTPRNEGIPRPGRDILQDINISFEEALHGDEKEIEVTTTEKCHICNGSGVPPGKALLPCNTCSGTGWKKEEKQTDEGPLWHMITCPACKGDGLILTNPCSNCKGNGWVKTSRLITLQIPAQIESGAEICILHHGEPGRYGGCPGHLRLSTYVAIHPLFTRTGNDITIRLPVSTSFAKQGGYLRIPDVKRGNSFLVKLPADIKRNMTFQVFDSADYTLRCEIEIYHPSFLFVQFRTRERLQKVKEWLGKVDYVLPAKPDKVEVVQTIKLKQDLDNKTKEQAAHPKLGTTPEVKPSPNQAKFYLKRGMLYEQKKDMDRALTDYNKALQLDPEFGSAYDKRGALYLHKNDLGEALPDLNKALELDSKLVNAYTNRGKVHFNQNRYGDAVKDFEKALFLCPGDAYLYLLLGQAYLNLGENDKAITFCKEVLNSSQNPKLCRQARLFLAYLKKSSYKDKGSQLRESIGTNRYVSLEELFFNAPTNFIEQKIWEKWENEYIGKYVKGKGRIVKVNLYPKEGRLFFVFSILGEQDTSENNKTQVAFLVEDSQSLKFGEKEGSFLIDGTKWIYAGENYNFEGSVSEISLLDQDLANDGIGDLIIVKGKILDIIKE